MSELLLIPYKSAAGFLWEHRLFVSVRGSSASRCSGRHLPERRAEISVCLMGRDGAGSAACGMPRGEIFWVLSPHWSRETGLCLSSPGDTALNKAVHAGKLRKTRTHAGTRACTFEGLWCGSTHTQVLSSNVLVPTAELIVSSVWQMQWYMGNWSRWRINCVNRNVFDVASSL